MSIETGSSATAGGSASTNGASTGSTGLGSTDTGSADTGDTGDDSSEGSESTESAASSEPATPRFKFKRGGRDLEHSAEEMRAMLDDDFEHDFHGIGGKPLLVDGKPVKMKFADIARAVQKHTGALEAIRRANAEHQRVNGLLELGKKPETRQAFFEQHLGVEDYDAWLYEQSRELLARDRRMLELAEQDPVAHQNELRKQVEAKFKRQQDSQERTRQAEQQRAQQAQQREQWWGTTARAFQAAKLPMNDRTRAIADGIAREYAEAGADLSFDELAQATRVAYHEEIFGYLDGHDDDSLLSIFGDKRRERLRQADLAALKGKKAAAKQADKPAAESASSAQPPRREPKGMTAAEFLGRGKNNGRI